MAETLDPALPPDIQQRADRVLETACDKELLLATAESCTGGLLAALLTDVPGCSHAFERGFVVYTDDAKVELLGVERADLETFGAVSREVAVAMAQGALHRSNAEIALSITGFAGPGGANDEEGLVHFACARRGHPTLHREEHFGAAGRQDIRLAALDTALVMIGQALED
jgi:nicotinamide-nucleotide amidase